MVKDAESHSDEDRRAKDLAVSRNEAESTVYDVQKSLTEHGDKIDADTRAGIESAIADVRSALEGGDADLIRAKTQALREASFKLAEVIYQQSGAQPGAEQPSSDARSRRGDHRGRRGRRSRRGQVVMTDEPEQRRRSEQRRCRPRPTRTAPPTSSPA